MREACWLSLSSLLVLMSCWTKSMDSTTLPIDDGVLAALVLVKVLVCKALRDGPELSGSGCSIILGSVTVSGSVRVACVRTLP